MNEKKPAGMSEAMQTEAIAEDNASLDTLSSLEIITRINENDQTVAQAVQRVLPQIAEAVELLVEALGNGGRLFYTGAGTSGRLGVVDASECPPTFGTPHEMVQGIIAGGRVALFHAREGCEDKDWMGARDLVRRGLRSGDVVCGLSTSGRTPYVLGALRKAREVGAKTIAVYCNPEGSVGQLADVAIVPVTGAEVVAGSTRMKAGTAEKMVLNMLSTATMVRLGRVSGNMMTNMKISCEKLRYRATRIIMQRLGVDEDEAWRLLAESKDDLAAIPGLQ